MSKKLQRIWMCTECKARIKRITGEKFPAPKECDCGNKKFV